MRICCVKNTLAAKKKKKKYGTVYEEIKHKNKKIMLATVYRPTKIQTADDIALYDEIQSLILNNNAIVVTD